ncbi:MAG: hypothetical protein K6L80_15575, partial [Agarilytica sp.]
PQMATLCNTMTENPHEKLASKLYIGIGVLLPIFIIGVSISGQSKNSHEYVKVEVKRLKRLCRDKRCYMETYIAKEHTPKRIYLPDFPNLKVGDKIELVKVCNTYNTRKPCEYVHETKL